MFSHLSMSENTETMNNHLITTDTSNAETNEDKELPAENAIY